MNTPDWKKAPILAETNGHRWFRFGEDKFLCCRVCGIVRRADDKNSPCPGPVKIALRNSLAQRGLDYEIEMEQQLAAFTASISSCNPTASSDSQL